MPLKPGAKGNPEPSDNDTENPIENTGDDATYTSSMAAAMESAFMAEWSKFNPDIDPPTGFGLEGLRLMFIAVARGVVDHLEANSASMKIEVTVGTGTGSGTVDHIDTDP